MKMMALKWVELAVTKLLPYSTDYSEGTSSTPALSCQCYQLTQYNRHVVLLNIQPYCQQKICLLITPVQKSSITGDTG